MNTDSSIGRGLRQDNQSHIEGGGAKISIGQVGNIIVGNNSTMVVTSKAKNKSQVIPCKYPLTTSNQPLTVDQKLEIKDKVGGQWKDLGRRLGISDPELEQLELENSSNYSEVIYQILSRWEQSMATKATREAIVKVFVKLGRGDLADLLSDSVASYN